MFLDFLLIDKREHKPLTILFEKIDSKIADISNLESLNIRIGSKVNINYDLYEDLTFYKEVLLESFCGSSCVPYSKDKIIAKINSLLHKNC
jgi:hypothetical protein